MEASTPQTASTPLSAISCSGDIVRLQRAEKTLFSARHVALTSKRKCDECTIAGGVVLGPFEVRYTDMPLKSKILRV